MWRIRPIVHPDLHRGSAMKRHTVSSSPARRLALRLAATSPGVELVVENASAGIAGLKMISATTSGSFRAVEIAVRDYSADLRHHRDLDSDPESAPCDREFKAHACPINRSRIGLGKSTTEIINNFLVYIPAGRGRGRLAWHELQRGAVPLHRVAIRKPRSHTVSMYLYIQIERHQSAPARVSHSPCDNLNRCRKFLQRTSGQRVRAC